MDPIDEKIMNLLRDGKPKEFEQLLSKLGHSHNTLRARGSTSTAHAHEEDDVVADTGDRH